MPRHSRAAARRKDVAADQPDNIEQAADKVGAELEKLTETIEKSLVSSIRERDRALRARIASLAGELESIVARVDDLGRRLVNLAPAGVPVPTVPVAATKKLSATPRSRKVRTFAALPRRLTTSTIEQYLLRHNIEVTNNRQPGTTGGGLWAFAAKAVLQPVVDELEQQGISCRYFRPGERRGDRRACWEIDRAKQLELE